MLSKLFNLFKKSKKEIKHQEVIDDIKSRIAKANGATIPHYSLENLSETKEQKEDKYKNATFVNKGCTSLEDFIINDDINEIDLEKLADLNQIQLQISKAWYPLVIELVKELHENGWNKKVSCIKEKYAGLRFYTNGKYDEIIEGYSKRAEYICETCGERGEIRYNTSWDYVACRKHYIENRGKVTIKTDGFLYSGNFYQWKDIEDLRFEDKDHNDKYRFLTIELKTQNVTHQGWRDNKLYISKNAIGFGALLKHLPKGYKNIDYQYIKQKFGKIAFCEICGYEAVYHDVCECCEHTTWESSQKRWKRKEEEKENYIKNNQIEWAIDDGDLYETQQGNYSKNPKHQIIYTDEDRREYLEYL